MADAAETISTVHQVSLGGTVLQMALALALILGIILLGYWMLRRFGPRLGLGAMARPHGLRLEGHMGLGPRKSLMVVRFAGKLLLLGVTDNSINLLSQTDCTDESTDFKTALDDARQRPGDAGPGDTGAGG
ncbi:flagellar biosynthetic protein FliO [Fundidesulfovibrio soli]|uniref:flagellar biosynthetic protein FliO n=1 Tax=Fundidesulfovibrio soli TaxID=2922716 RepID=UPI001FAF629D|nr:flagellar biosynthetic protein FliO [Fundidesulfovibrio soli]